MNAPVTRRVLLGATAAVGAITMAGVSAVAAMPAVADIAIPSRTASSAPDATLILLAGRVAVLAGRLWRADERCSTLEDRVFVARRDRLPLPPEPPLDTVIEHRSTTVERVMVVREPLVASPARAEWCRIRDAAKAATDRRASDLAERIGLPALERRRGRMLRRLDRWTRRLAVMEPATASGLGVKARTLMAIGGGRRCGIEVALTEHHLLVASVLRDAARLGMAGAAHA